MFATTPFFTMPILCLCGLLFVCRCTQAPQPTTNKDDKEQPKDTLIVVNPLPTNEGQHTFDYDTSEWTELIHIDTSFQLNLKYATTDNFVKEQMYACGRCFLRPEAAKALVKAHAFLQQKGYGLQLLDCYRPHTVQRRLWQKYPNASYVTPPAKGSMHNRGLAVDLTLTDSLGNVLDMGTPFDFFGKKAHHTCTDLPKEIIQRRTLLRETMRHFGFKHIRTEWWHYSYVLQKASIADYEWQCD